MRFPLRDLLQDPVSEAALHRVLQGMDARAHARKRQRRAQLVLGALVAIAVVIVGASRFHRDAGPLRFADGREFVAVDASGSTREINLSDGSRIRLSPGTHIEPLESSGTSFSAVVTEGRADFDVRPGGPRHWVIECGLATVEVIGTQFACEREPGKLRVVVRHGVVLVRGERVPHRAHRLSGGETLDVAEQVPRSAPATTGNDHPSALPESAGSSDPNAPVTVAGTGNREDGNSEAHVPLAKTWKELARNGRQREAFAALGVEGLRRESRKLGVNDLLALADVARLSGHPAEAVVPLDRILAEFSNDAQAPLAAFALGRLELDSLGHSRASISAFNKALALGIPRSLREDVRARLVEAHARSGDSAGAQRAADAYFDEFPNGRHARAIRVWLHQR
jgi:transmembrane sensor